MAEEKVSLTKFKIDWNSPMSSKLKSAISDKLLHFLVDYNDDVLAEYITVLICNGKDQVQTKDDLEAFLVERTGEFVSWLWDYLLKYAHASKDVLATRSTSGSTDKDLRSNRSEDVHTYNNGYSDSSLVIPPWTSILEHLEDSQSCKVPAAVSNQLQSSNEQLQSHRPIIGKEFKSSGKNCGHTLRPSAITTRKAQSFEGIDKSELIDNQKGSVFACLDSSLEGEMASKSLDPSAAERVARSGPHGRETYAANVSVEKPLETVAEVSCQSKKSRGSVWDRLGKPCEGNFVVKDKSVDAHMGYIVEKHSEAEEQPELSRPAQSEKVYRSIHHGVRVLCKDFEANYSDDRRRKQNASAICKPFAENNIRLKRTYSDISSNPNLFSASSVFQNCLDSHIKESSQDLKKLNSAEAAAPVLFSQVKDVRQKLQQIEMEVSKLRTKQLEMSKVGQLPLLSSSGILDHSDENVDSRTVFASNVHFAATKEALTSHFAKCGPISRVILLTDKLKGSAYITFASKDSIEKAEALNGTSFFSRSLKVVRKGKEAKVTTKPTPCIVKPLSLPPQATVNGKTSFEMHLNHPKTQLQWRCEPVFAQPGL